MVTASLLAMLLLHTHALAADWQQGFDGEQTSWEVEFDKTRMRQLSHRRHAHIFVQGRSSEHLHIETSRQGGLLRLEHALPPARVIDELTLALWVRSNRPGVHLALRLILPHEKDPGTNAVLSTWLRGEAYTRPGKWQRLTCQARDREVNSRLVLLRARLKKSNIDTRDMYVDRAILMSELGPGSTEFFLDEMHLSPVVSPRKDAPVVQVRQETTVEAPHVDFRLDRLNVEGRPFFPRVTAFHQESPAQLKQAGMNLIWVPDAEDQQLLEQLRSEGLWAMATPPRAVSPIGDILDAESASLLPFTEKSRPILVWYAGTRIPAEAGADLITWNSQIRSADRKFRRPLMADVAGAERVFSRHVGLLGVSRHLFQTGLEFREYRDWLIQRRKLARPGSFVWTWIQTEPDPGQDRFRNHARKRPLVIEPEQIRLQLYSALSAGCRGVGYWKTAPLDSGNPGAKERELCITQLNLELQLMEPWLATGTVVGRVPFEVGQRPDRTIGRGQLDFRNAAPDRPERQALLNDRESQASRRDALPSELEATIIRGDHGVLLLPIWYGRGAQYVPGQMVANDATIVVPGVDESASAWEITTTGIRSLSRKRVAGGIRVTIPKFDQTTAIVLSADRRLITQLRSKSASLAQQSADVSLKIAQAKLERVREVDTELQSLGNGQPDAPQILSKAGELADQAQAMYSRGDYHGTRLLAGDVMQLLRILQRAHWDDAVRDLAAPTSSPHTWCFQTLPDHWELVRRIGRTSASTAENLLRSGNFEDQDTILVEGWQHGQNEAENIIATAELSPQAREGRYSLRLAAMPRVGDNPPSLVEKPPVTVTTPPIPVRAGQVVHVSGWVRVPSPVAGASDGVTLHDNIAGKGAALRWSGGGDWRRFELMREVYDSHDLRLTFTLHGLGEAQLDDLRVVPLEPPSPLAAEQPDPARTQPSAADRALEFFNRLPGLRSRSAGRE